MIDVEKVSFLAQVRNCVFGMSPYTYGALPLPFIRSLLSDGFVRFTKFRCYLEITDKGRSYLERPGSLALLRRMV